MDWRVRSAMEVDMVIDFFMFIEDLMLDGTFPQTKRQYFAYLAICCLMV